MNYLNFIILPLTGFVIGFFTNWVAVKMLFYPRKKVLGFQGVIPKRKKKIAEKIAESSLNFLPSSLEKLSRVPYIGEKILNYIKREVAKKVNEMDDDELQRIIENVARQELFFIEVLGGLLGLILGFVQALIVSFVL